MIEDPKVNKRNLIEKLIEQFNSEDFTQIKKLFIPNLEEPTNDISIKQQSFSQEVKSVHT